MLCSVVSSKVLVLSHHKGGTVLSYPIYAYLCYPDNNSDAASMWPRYEQVVKHRSCSDVIYQANGVNFEIIDFVVQNVTVHFLRHPVDMLVSGYIFHKSCQENWGSPIRTPLTYPKNFAVTGSYCEWLKKVDLETGIRMELYRSLYAGDGIGNMLKAVAYFDRNKKHPKRGDDIELINVCMNDAARTFPYVEKRLQRYNKYNNTLHLEDVSSHHSSVTTKHALYKLAMRIVAESIPTSVLLSFPCSSSYSMFESDEYSKEFIHGLDNNEHTYRNWSGTDW